MGFITIFSHKTQIVGPGAQTEMWDDGNWFKSLPNPQFVCMKPIKPLKKHLKSHKIGQKIMFHRNFQEQNTNCWSKCMWNNGDWFKSLPNLQFVCMKPIKTTEKIP